MKKCTLFATGKSLRLRDLLLLLILDTFVFEGTDPDILTSSSSNSAMNDCRYPGTSYFYIVTRVEEAQANIYLRLDYICRAVEETRAGFGHRDQVH